MGESEMGGYQLKVLIVEDDPIDARFFENILRKSDCEAVLASSSEEAVKILAEQDFDLVMTDLMMDGMDGIDLLRLVKRYHPSVEVVIITAHASVDFAVEAMKWGAFSYFLKGDPASKLIKSLESIRRMTQDRQDLFRSNLTDIEAISLKTRNRHFRDVLRLGKDMAGVDGNVLLHGRPGPCLCSFAKYMHIMGKAAHKRFVHITAAMLGEAVEGRRRLIAHERVNELLGDVHDAGTVFLESIDKVDADILEQLFQYLNRADQQNTTGYTVNRARVIASCTDGDKFVDLESTGLRMYCPIVLVLPGLNDRPEDIPMLAAELLPLVNEETGCSIREISDDLKDALSHYVYTTNMESLFNVLCALARNCSGGILSRSDLSAVDISVYAVPEDSFLFPGEPESLRSVRDRAELQHIAKVLERTGGSRGKSAKVLGITPRQLYNKIVQFNLD